MASKTWNIKTDAGIISSEDCPSANYWKGFVFLECGLRPGFRCRAIKCPIRTTKQIEKGSE